jgi:aspartate racemase
LETTLKTLGLIGGTGWISTAEYYRLINEMVNEKLGELNFADLFLYSFNYNVIYELYKEKKHPEIYQLVENAANKLISSGAEGIVLCANTLHFYANDLVKNISIPIIHIADATSKSILNSGLEKVGLLGTKTTMEEDFYKSRLNKNGINVIVPDLENRNFIHDSIFNELLKGIFKDDTKSKILEIINKLNDKGANGIILGCTEIPLIIKKEDSSLPLFDTTLIHAEAAADFAVS